MSFRGVLGTRAGLMILGSSNLGLNLFGGLLHEKWLSIATLDQYLRSSRALFVAYEAAYLFQAYTYTLYKDSTGMCRDLTQVILQSPAGRRGTSTHTLGFPAPQIKGFPHSPP